MTLSKIFARVGGSAYSREFLGESFFKDSKTIIKVWHRSKFSLDHCLLCMWWLLKEPFCVVLLQRSFYYSSSSSSSLSVSISSSILSSLSARSNISSVYTASSSVPSSALEMPQDWKDLLTMSAGISCQASFTQRRTRLRVGAFFLPAGVNSNGPVISHYWYFLLMLSLNGLFRHLSKGCSTGVKPPGITATSIFRCWRLLFTESVRWPRNESHTNKDRSSPGFRGKQLRIHSLTPTITQRNKQINLQTFAEGFFHVKLSNYCQCYSLPVARSRKYQKFHKKFISYIYTLFIHPSLLVEWHSNRTRNNQVERGS